MDMTRVTTLNNFLVTGLLLLLHLLPPGLPSVFPTREQSNNLKARIDILKLIRNKLSRSLKLCNIFQLCSNPSRNSIKQNISFTRMWLCNANKLCNKEIPSEQILDWSFLVSKRKSRNYLQSVLMILGTMWMRIKELLSLDGIIRVGLWLKSPQLTLSWLQRPMSSRFKIIKFLLWMNVWDYSDDLFNKHISDSKKLSAIRMIKSLLILLN